MAEVIGAKVEIDASSVGNVRKQLKEATADLVAMQQKFGATSNEALEAAKRVAGLKDRIQEARETADLFDPGNKFKAIGNAVGSIAQGFTAVQGAMGLMGVESKEVEKQLLRVQSAMALSQGLSGIADSAKDFARLGSIIKTQVVTAFSTLRGAIAATGIGLLISGVALLIENFDAIKKVIYDTFPALKGLFDNFDRIKQIARGVGEVILKWVAGPAKAIVKLVQGDFKGAVDELKGMFNVAKNFREGEQKEIKAQEAERAAADAERLKKEKEKNDKLAAERKRAADAAAKQRAAEIAKEKADYDKRNADRLKQERDLQQKIDEILFGYRKKQEDDDAKSAADKMRLEKKRALDNLISLGANAGQILEATRFWDGQIKNEEEKARTESLKNIQAGANATIAALQATSQKNLQIAKEEYEAKEALRQSEMRLYADVGASLSALSDLIGRETAAGKALAIAQATINTWLGVTEVLKQKSVLPEPAATISKIVNAATIVASGLSAVRNIVKTRVPGGGGGAPTGGGGRLAAAPIAANLSPQTQLQLQNQQAINNMGNQSMRAYVLNSDIRNNNQRNAYLQRNSRIG
jgi:hypothetical protein